MSATRRPRRRATARIEGWLSSWLAGVLLLAAACGGDGSGGDGVDGSRGGPRGSGERAAGVDAAENAVAATAAETPALAPGEVPDPLADARSAAPRELAADATVVSWSGDTLQRGTNGWVCYPDAPDTPLRDPMCLDAPLQEFLRAWQERDRPAFGKIGFGYMLQGGGGESASEPYADHPEEVDDWVVAGPHLLVIVPDEELLAGLPTEPGLGEPWLMWAGTPYAHVMVPTPRRVEPGERPR